MRENYFQSPGRSRHNPSQRGIKQDDTISRMPVTVYLEEIYKRQNRRGKVNEAEKHSAIKDLQAIPFSSVSRQMNFHN